MNVDSLTQNDVTPYLLKLVKRITPKSNVADLNEHTKLIRSGIVDSLAIMQIVTEIEMDLGVKIPDENINPDSFGTINKISNLVVGHPK